MSRVNNLFTYLKQTFQEWQRADAFGKSAALAYYTVFSLPGLLILILQVAGLVWSTAEVQAQLTDQVREVLGPEAARQVQTVIVNSQQQAGSTLALIAGVATMIFGATGVFFQLQKSLNDVWGVELKPDAGIVKMLISRLTALGLVLAIGFLLLVSMLLTAAISLLRDWIQQQPIDLPSGSIFLMEEVVAFLLFTVLFALIFKILPDVDIRWRFVWPGALITSLLFTLGKFLLGFYFGQSDPTSAFGAAGSIVLLLLWAYYSGLIFLFGAAFTHVYARRRGGEIPPAEFARYKAEYRLRQEEHAAP